MTLEEYVGSLTGKRICVIGAGVSNYPLIKLLALSGIDVTVCDMMSPDKIGERELELVSCGAKLSLGEAYLDNLDYDVIFRTPGLMPFNPKLAEAKERGALVTSEMEVFFSLCPCRTVAVTGSDGKTTTTTIISEILKRDGFNVHVGGNIGKPLLCELPFFKADDIAVLELSSFQLHSMYCSPDVSVITNISPNHLDKHKDYDDYISSKASIFINQKPFSRLVLNMDDEISMSTYLPRAVGNVCMFSIFSEPSYGAFLKDGNIFISSGDGCELIMSADEIRLPGIHNIKNYIAAFSALEGIASRQAMIDTAREFTGVEHRLETVRTVNGVRYINDSIGTSPTRTIAGIDALKDKPVLMLGGYDKHIPFDTLADCVCRKVKAVFISGATCDKIYEAILSSPCFTGCGLEIFRCEDFDAAFKAASLYAKPGDTVLLSPACAAFDSFKNFAERGKYFKKLVMEL